MSLYNTEVAFIGLPLVTKKMVLVHWMVQFIEAELCSEYWTNSSTTI